MLKTCIVLKYGLKNSKNNYQASKKSENDTSSGLYELQQFKMKKAAIGPRHFAFLTEDGQICRVGFHASPRVLEKKEKLQEKESSALKENPASKSSASYSMSADIAKDIRLALQSRSHRGRMSQTYHRRPPGKDKF